MSRRSAVQLTPMRRHLAAVVTIALSCAFVAIMVLAGNLMLASLQSQAAQTYDGADLAIEVPLSDADWTSEEPLAAPEIEGAEQVWPMVQSFTELTAGQESGFFQVTMLPPGDAGAEQLLEGAPAASSSEIVLDESAAEALGVGLGDTVALPGRMAPSSSETALEVVGIAPAPEGAVFGGTPRVLVDEANVEALLGPTAGTLTDQWLATVPEGTDAGAVAEAASDDDQTVLTAQEAIDEQAAKAMNGTAALGMLLAVFVVIALFTSAVVIANTFAVTIAQRTRSLALLRTLGATRSQVRGVVLRESALVGVLGAVVGMAAGHVLVQAALAAAAALGWLQGVMVVPVSVLSVLLPVLAGVAITLGASLAPMRAATRVAPLQALRPAPPQQRRGLGVRGVLGLIGLVLGVAALAGGSALALSGSTALGTALALLGGVLSFLGVLATLVLLTRPLSTLGGRLIGRIGRMPARVASANVSRNPRRSAATIAALLIGTTLMTMMAVGARTAESTLTSELDSRRPIDLVVSAPQMPGDAAEQIAAIDGIDRAIAGQRGDIEVGAEEPMTLYSATPETVREVSHRPEMAEELADGVVLLGQERAESFGVEDGQVLRIDAADGTAVALEVHVDANLQMSLVTPATLEQLLGQGTTPVVLGDFADPGTPERAGTDVYELIDEVSTLVQGEGFEEASVQAGGAEREMYGQVLTILLGITVGLLAVAVVVALVGVANTLSLGVIERRGENALLRALGTTRRQMRAMLAWEGVLLALVGAILGLALGTAYGILGITTLLGGIYPVTITIPWAQLAVVLVLSVMAGLLASVLPGRSAARTAPAAALADAD
ncbi:ABC transporter permease [Brachybacterium sp. YJGR34]|uniref:ABC transporter permease n=1 Tax=Brachybacterium sp. YJGR34 TaxID=2059911 RepID=UPI000E0C1F12|nr:ABC transporter permease [Brachybacterium sp. YJGR34]